jgi:hypothetical protein
MYVRHSKYLPFDVTAGLEVVIKLLEPCRGSYITERHLQMLGNWGCKVCKNN